jgi:hypothetical protein
MPALQRSVALRGPRFYADDGKLMFVNVFDAFTRDGPREATEADAEAHPQAAGAYVEQAEGEPLKPLVAFEGEEPADQKAQRTARTAEREARRAG